MTIFNFEPAWISQIFESQQAVNGGIVRRSILSVRKHCTEAELTAAVKARGFHIVKTDTQYVIFCNHGNLKMVA